jgi:phytoene dehydrogenase-like protein
MTDRPIVIVGGGLAGLCCARRLAAQGIGVQVLEASAEVGGRVRTVTHTNEHGSYRIDRGFQVYLDAYPEGRSVLNTEALGLRAFEPGAGVWTGRKMSYVFDPFRRPVRAAAAFASPIAGVGDILPLTRMHQRLVRTPLPELWAQPEIPTIELLRQAGLSEKIIDGFFRPFFGGVFFDRELATSARFFSFVYRMFAKGSATLPREGMNAIPLQIANALPSGVVRTGTPVESVKADGVVLVGGEQIEAKAVVVATDEPGKLVEIGARARGWRSIVSLAYDAPVSPMRDAVVALDSTGHGPVNHLAVVSDAQPTLAPQGRSLILASVLGGQERSDAELDAAVKTQLSGWFGPEQVEAWTLLRAERIDHALPDQSAGCLEPIRRSNRADGVWLAGDGLDNASINGAMESGRRAAENMLSEL